MLYETAAQQHVWTLLADAATDADRDAAVERTIAAYLATGVTGVVDMAFDELGLAAFDRAAERRGGTLPSGCSRTGSSRTPATTSANLAQVARAVELAGEHSPWLKVAGIKLVLDGVIDACTAAMRHPYADGSNAEPIWPLERVAARRRRRRCRRAAGRDARDRRPRERRRARRARARASP